MRQLPIPPTAHHISVDVNAVAAVTAVAADRQISGADAALRQQNIRCNWLTGQSTPVNHLSCARVPAAAAATATTTEPLPQAMCDYQYNTARPSPWHPRSDRTLAMMANQQISCYILLQLNNKLPRNCTCQLQRICKTCKPSFGNPLPTMLGRSIVCDILAATAATVDLVSAVYSAKSAIK
ncbi:unnamed protein product [Ceratitis capitata]|uniref:(Mediterranean fruit fly) hypothetical protein n=1 Tax=Ceratitis capitata TaxID=7213 RepID=A0A811TYW6_CERCA|nr:unnamed protein product [Ceratitis capitata]